jgi:uncharacterized RDD family membrane protein YckC
MEEQTTHVSPSHEEEVEYPRAALYKRWFAFIIDLFLAVLSGMIFFSLGNLIIDHVPSYEAVVEKRDEMQVQSGLYDSNHQALILTVSNSTDSYDVKKDTLAKAIEAFYANTDYFTTDSYYQEYQSRKKAATDSSGNPIFVEDSAHPGTYLEGSYSSETYYNFYYSEIDKHCLGYLSLNATYKDLTNVIFRAFILLLFAGMTIGYLLFFFVLPWILKRGRKTLGMYLFRISLVSNEGLNLTAKQYLLRSLLQFVLGYLLSLATFGIPILVSVTMMHLSKAHQDFFDYLTKTYMVDTANKDVYLDYAEYLSRKGLSQEATLENKDFQLPPK